MADYPTHIEIETDIAGFLAVEIGETAEARVYLVHADGDRIDVTNSPDTTAYTIDDPVSWNTTTAELVGLRPGRASLRASYVTTDGRTLVTDAVVICYEAWLRDNYLKLLLSKFDSTKIINSPQTMIILRTCVELMDILFAYAEEARTWWSPRVGRQDALEGIGMARGFEKLDATDLGSSQEPVAERLFRELLKNLSDILSIRGTTTATEVFFGALGYNVDVEEFWYDEDGNLIEIDPDNERESTFYAYDINGNAIDSPQVARPDPRTFIGETVLQNNKSNYVRITLSSKDPNIALPPSAFGIDKRAAIRRYLDWLRPQHIQYIQELLGIGVGDDIISQLSDVFSASLLLTAALLGPDEIAELNDVFIVGALSLIASDELNFPFRWDIGLEWDSGVFWDIGGILIDEFSATPL